MRRPALLKLGDQVKKRVELVQTIEMGNDHQIQELPLVALRWVVLSKIVSGPCR